MKRLLSLLAFAMLSANAQQTVNAPRTSAPLIDGKINDECWKKTEWNTGFTILNRPEIKSEPQTRFKVVHDNSSLYIAAEMDEPAMDQLKAQATNRDGKVHRDDCLEIFIDANRDKSSYKHFAINSTGTLFDSERRQGGHVSTSQWNSAGIKIGTSKQQNKWLLEIGIPFVDLGINDNAKWGLNISRARQINGKHLFSSFTPLTGDFHQPANFDVLNLQNADLSYFNWTIKPPYSVKTVILGGKKILEGKTYISNRTGRFCFVKLTSKLADGGEQIQTFALDDGLGHEFSFKVPAGEDGKVMLNIDLADRRTGNPVASMQFPEVVSYAPISLDLVEPFYRNCIFSDQKISALKGTVEFGLNPEALKQTGLKLSLLTPNGKIIASQSTAKVQEKNVFCLNIPELPYGDYTLIAATPDNKYKAQVTIKKLKPFQGETRIDKNLTTYIDGRKFFPYGWFSISKDCWQKVKKEGVNVVFDYCAYFKTDSELKEWLDDLHKVGLKAAIFPYPSRIYNNAETWGKPLSESETEGIRSFVGKWKQHPALLGWYLGDEPELRPALPARMLAIYNTCKDEDPYHPCILLNDTTEGIRKYIDGSDIFNPDPYPLFLQGGDAARPIEKVGNFINTIFEAGKDRKAAWISPQAFNYGDYGAVNNRPPNFLELRNMQYQAIIAGAQGFSWFTWKAALQYPVIGLSMKYLTKEVRSLENVILSPEKRIVLKTNSKLCCAVMYRDVNGQSYVFAVNNSKKTDEIVIDLPSESSAKWHVIGENRLIGTVDGKIIEKFSKYDTNLYTTDKKLADSFSVSAAQKEVDEGVKALNRPGNLAFIDNGVKISFSSTKDRRAFHVIDGSRTGSGWTDNTKGKFPDWMKIDFGKTVTIGRAEIFSTGITKAEIQVMRNGKWVKSADFVRVSPNQMTAKCKPLKTESARVLIKGSSTGNTSINELEIYEK